MYIVYMLALLLPFVVTQASAQQTITLTNKATGEKVGSITMTGDRSYLRDKDGNHVETIVRNKDGTATTYDPNGKVMETKKLK
jgi:hypothetical protein